MAVSEFLSRDELRQLVELRPWKSNVALVTDWLLISANFALVILVPHPVVWFLSFWFAARQQLALAILMHDGSHRRLSKSGRINDWIGQFFCAGPLWFSMYSYQQLHLKHHQKPLAEDDPDLSLTGGYPIAKMSLFRKLFRDLIGLSYFKFIRYFIYIAINKRKSKAPLGLKKDTSHLPMSLIVISMLLSNALIFSVLYLLGHPLYYLFFWLLPAFTSLQVLLRIRGIAEHAGYEVNEDQRLNARTMVNPIQAFIFAPHNVNLHIEHHVYPAVPFYNLKRLHAIFSARELLPPKNVYRGYGQIIRELVL